MVNCYVLGMSNKHKLKYIGLIGVWLVAVLTIGCKKDDGISVPLNSEVNEFVWQGLRTYYLWKSDVPDLGDDRFGSFDELHEFLNQFSTPEFLFDHFKHSRDRFSIIVSDYVLLENSLQGVSRSFGFEFELLVVKNTSNVFGYVEYILPDSPAELAGLKRGDVFHAVNGVELSEDNFAELLYSTESITMSLGDFISITEGVVSNGQRISMSKVDLSENPVFLTKTFDVAGQKVGYLVYNQFIGTFHSELNAAIGQLNAEGVNEMILDLRYNSGGLTTTSQILASMLYSSARVSDVFGSIRYNELLSDFNRELNFYESVPILNKDNETIGEETMNRLDLNRLFILTGDATASASELVISALQPYMDVIVIGNQTVGKNVGSTIVYDSPDFSKNNRNPTHRYVMLPIISELSNAADADYSSGLVPAVLVDEKDLIASLKPLGDVEEALLVEAFGIISQSGRTESPKLPDLERIHNSRSNRLFSANIVDRLAKSELILND